MGSARQDACDAHEVAARCPDTVVPRVVRRVTTDAASQSGEHQGFSDRVLVFFLTQVVTAGLVLFNGFFLARLIGPSGKGDYYLLTFLPRIERFEGRAT